ncbi:hypothetical protein MTO96_051720 [Rhipicephalus appendiculatus]
MELHQHISNSCSHIPVLQSESCDKSTSTVNVHEFTPKALCGYESLSPIEENDEALKDLTGVSAACFSILLGILAQMRTPRATDITVGSRLLLFLMKMKHGLTFAALGALFSVHRTTASRVFYAVLDVLHAKTQGWLVWFPREVVQETMPPSFREKYPTCRVIIDCTEVSIETPPEVSEQVNCWSSYKSNFTLKFLVGVAPCGFISYVSEVFGGRASDTYITANCGLLDLLEKDDLVLADKGFPHIRCDLESRQLSLRRQRDTLNDILDSENIADLVGTVIAYAAFAALSPQEKNETLAGLDMSSEQLFFVNHCVKWCSGYRTSGRRYAPYRSRCIVPLMNMPEFSRAFGCGPGTPMNPTEKCTFW